MIGAGDGCGLDCFSCPYPDCVKDRRAAGRPRMEETPEAEADRKHMQSLSRGRIYYERHRDEILARRRAAREADPEFYRIKRAEYRKRHEAKKAAERSAAQNNPTTQGGR